MSVLKNLEARISGVVEGAFSRAFKSELRPIEIARKLVRELDSHRTNSLSRTYVPNEYVVWLSKRDYEQFAAYERELADELCGYMLEYARAQKFDLVGRPSVRFEMDPKLRLGEFGIEAKAVRSGEDRRPQPTPPRPQAHRPPSRPAYEESPPPPVASAAALHYEGSVFPLVHGGIVGRSRECNVVIDDPNVSRRHARFDNQGGKWLITDLGSTNGVLVNGRHIGSQHPVQTGDVIELGTLTLTFTN